MMQTPPNIAPKNRNVFFVGLLSFFGGISQDIFIPIIPIYYTSVLGFDKTFVGVAEGLVTASGYIFNVISGLFSDRLKKQKPIIFAGYFLSMVSRPLLAFFTSGASILGLRFTDGMGKGIKDPAKDVLIADSAEREVRGRSFGIVRMLDTLGSVVGPLILFGLLYFLSGSASLYHYILVFTAIPLLITLFILVTQIREVNHPRIDTRSSAQTFDPPLPKSFYIFLGIVILFTLGNSSDAFLVLRARSVGVTLLEIPLVIALFNLVYAVFAVPMGTLSDKIGRVPTILIGWVTYAIAYVGFAFASHAYAIWLMYGLYGIYYAANLGVAKAFLADMVGFDHRGRAFGVYGMTVGFATLAASFFAGFLWDKIGPQAPFIFGAAMATVASLALLSFTSKFRSGSLRNG